MLKRHMMGISVLFLAMLACNFLPSTSEPPDDSTIETLTAATLNAQATLLPTETQAPTATTTREDLFPIVTATSYVAPQPTPSTTPIFRDDFDESIDKNWSWIREDQQRWSLTEKPGFLQIVLDPNNCRGNPGNFPLVAPPKGDYLIETRIEFTPENNFQMAGLIVYQDDLNYLKFGRAFCNLEGNCVGNGIYFDNMKARTFSGPNFATSVDNSSLAYLRLQHHQGTYTGYFSEDGENWTMIGEHDTETFPKGIGLFTGQSCNNSLPADFDYFTISQVP